MKEQKVKFFKTMRMKIVAIILGSCIITIAINLVTSIPAVRSQLSEQADVSLQTIGGAYGLAIQELYEKDAGQITYEEFNKILGNEKVMGHETGYLYVVDGSGKMLYHPMESKVGSQVENEVITDVVGQLAQGVIPESKTVTYDFRGTKKYASYKVIADGNMVVVATVDYEDIYHPFWTVVNQMTIGNIINIVFIFLLGFGVASLMIKPMKRLEKMMNRIADLNLTHDDDLALLMKRGDEYGNVSRATKKMKDNVREVVQYIIDASNSINQNADELNTIAKEVSEDASDNSATSEELAAGMQETSATTEAIDSNLSQIETNTSNINKLTDGSKEMAQGIMKRANRLMATTKESSDAAKAMYLEVKEKTTTAINKSKEVEKIHSLTDAIMQIASQTSLLSLNASIEAARAGESGRGFAVVAHEIGSLATQSSNTVTDITKIVEVVQSAVDNMADCLGKTLEYLETTVSKDYNTFQEVSQQYNEDATSVNNTMEIIDKAIDELSGNVTEIAQAITGISQTINEAAAGVTDIAQKTSNTVTLTCDTSRKVEQCVQFAEQLKKEVGRFQV